MADPISIGIALAKFVPDVVGWLAGEKKKEAAETLLDIAEGLTGKKKDDALKAIENDPNLALQYKKAVMSDKHKLDEMFLEDRQNARDMSVKSDKMADLANDVAKRIMKTNLPFVFLLILAQCLVMVFVPDKTIVALASNAIGFVLNALLNERQAVVGFLFGSSMGSKLKTIIEKNK